MTDGWVKLYRQSIENGWLKNHKLWVFWTYCLMKATHKKHTDFIGYQQVNLDPGQFVFGRKKAAEETWLSERSVRTCLDILKKSQNVTSKTTSKYTVITICNWETYQVSDDNNRPAKRPATDQQPTSNRPATDHIQECKNEKNEKKKDLLARGNEFALAVREFNTYPKSMTDAFVKYWTEPNISKTKMKFELEKTWDLSRRLDYWARNDKNFNKGVIQLD